MVLATVAALDLDLEEENALRRRDAVDDMEAVDNIS